MIWIISYSIALLIILLGVIYYFGKARKKNGFIFFMLIAVSALTVLSFPVERTFGSLTIFEAVLASVLDAIYVVRGDVYHQISISNFGTFSLIYTCTYLVIQTIAIVFTVGTVLSFLRVPMEKIKLWSHAKTIVLLSAYNAKTKAIAESFASEKVKVFFNNCGEVTAADKRKALESGAAFLGISTTKVIKYFARKKREIKLYIFEENDEKNITTLDSILNVLETTDIRGNIRIFVELNEMSWDEQNKIKLTQLSGKITLNFTRTEENFAINNLFSNSIFDNCIEKEGKKHINFLIVGVDGYSTEMIKNVLTLGQMPGYFINLYVVDENAGLENLKYQIPELKTYVNEFGYAAYSVTYFESVNPISMAFEKLMEDNFLEFTFAFVNLHDVQRNNEMCRILNKMRVRNDIKSDCKIQVLDFSQKASKVLNVPLFDNTEVVGTMAYLYSHNTIECSEIEKQAMEIHTIRHGDSVSWYEYSNDEYKRRSTFNRALSDKYKQQIIHRDYDSNMNLLTEDDTWVQYEHMRWLVYTQTIGYVLGKKKDVLAKTHNDLVPFNQLTKAEQDKDKRVQ